MSRSERIALALLARRAITLDQLLDAQQRQRRQGGGLDDALVALGLVSRQQAHDALARAQPRQRLDLTDLRVPVEVIEFVPESVARENTLLPLAYFGRALLCAAVDPEDFDLVQKLEFILNRPVTLVAASRQQIVAAIDRHYGLSETESVDSMLAEFTDTAIDFTTTEPPAPGRGERFDLTLDDDGLLREEVTLDRPPAERRATVRYYHRMAPERTFPLLVVLSRGQVARVAKRGVSQGESAPFQVAEGTLVEIEPVLPGCACFPPKEQVRVSGGDVTVTFWVVPHVLGELMQARVVLRHDGDTLAEVPLQARVARQTLTLLAGALGLVAPFVLLLLKHFELDFESQAKDGFAVYAAVGGWLLRWLTPEVLGGALLALALGLYLWLRPRARDVFWDVSFVAPAAPQPPPGERPEARWVSLADARYEAHDYAQALALYERVLGRPEARCRDYFRASLAAYRLGDVRRALGILSQAEARLPSGEMRAVVWYNMGCFASRLGLIPDALRYLRRAADGGLRDVRKYRDDPDLETLRWSPAFRELLVGLSA